jgi:Arc/MetJ-type ribon-helix-helix transcriptional regulator
MKVPNRKPAAASNNWPTATALVTSACHLRYGEYGHTMTSMATPTIKSTYSLDPQTVRDLERLARKYGTSKSDVLRRAVQSLAAQEMTPEAEGLVALGELQERIGLTAEKADAWVAEVRSERAEFTATRTDD